MECARFEPTTSSSTPQPAANCEQTALDHVLCCVQSCVLCSLIKKRPHTTHVVCKSISTHWPTSAMHATMCPHARHRKSSLADQAGHREQPRTACTHVLCGAESMETVGT